MNHRPNIANNEVTAMQVLAKAADAFSDGDLITRRVRMKQEWNLMPAAAVLGTVYPAAYMRCVLQPRAPCCCGIWNFEPTKHANTACGPSEGSGSHLGTTGISKTRPRSVYIL